MTACSSYETIDRHGEPDIPVDSMTYILILSKGGVASKGRRSVACFHVLLATTRLPVHQLSDILDKTATHNVRSLQLGASPI